MTIFSSYVNLRGFSDIAANMMVDIDFPIGSPIFASITMPANVNDNCNLFLRNILTKLIDTLTYLGPKSGQSVNGSNPAKWMMRDAPLRSYNGTSEPSTNLYIRPYYTVSQCANLLTFFQCDINRTKPNPGRNIEPTNAITFMLYLLCKALIKPSPILQGQMPYNPSDSSFDAIFGSAVSYRTQWNSHVGDNVIVSMDSLRFTMMVLLDNVANFVPTEGGTMLWGKYRDAMRYDKIILGVDDLFVTPGLPIRPKCASDDASGNVVEYTGYLGIEIRKTQQWYYPLVSDIRNYASGASESDATMGVSNKSGGTACFSNDSAVGTGSLVFNGGVFLDPRASYVVLPRVQLSKTMAFTCWWKSNQNSAFARIIDLDATFRLSIEGGNVLLFNDVRIVSNRDLNNGTWNFIAINVNALSVSWVINAGETGNRGSGALSSPVAATNAVGYLGHSMSNGPDFNGAMSDVRLFGETTLTSIEIDGLYALRNKPMAGSYTTFRLPNLPSNWATSPSTWSAGGVTDGTRDGLLGYLSSFGRRWTSKCSPCDSSTQVEGHAVVLSTAMTGDFECILSYGTVNTIHAMLGHASADPADFTYRAGNATTKPTYYDQSFLSKSFNTASKTYSLCAFGLYAGYTSGSMYWQYKRVGTICTIKYSTTSSGPWIDCAGGAGGGGAVIQSTFKIVCMIGTTAENLTQWPSRNVDATIVSCSADQFT
jgi:hypothetical protein